MTSRSAPFPLFLFVAAAAAAHIPAAALHNGTHRQQPSWPYNWGRFPAFWFGANASGWESGAQLQLMTKYSMVLFGWQHMQLATNYTNLLHAQVAQARRAKAVLPAGVPVFVYTPVADTQPFYAASAPLFEDFARYADFFFLNDTAGRTTSALWPDTTGYKCEPLPPPNVSTHSRTRGHALARRRGGGGGSGGGGNAPPRFVIIDVRTPAEWSAGHISCARGPLAIQDDPTGWQDMVAKWTGGDKSVYIVTYCAVGVRAGRARQALLDAGYTNVTDGGGFEHPADLHEEATCVCSTLPTLGAQP